MQNQTQTLADFIGQAASDAIVSAHTATTEAQAKLAAKAKRIAERHNASVKQPATANGKAAQKRVSAKAKPGAPSVTAKPAKPDQASRDAAREQKLNDRRLAHDVAAIAVAAFYAGSSKPFKAAADSFAPINFHNAKPGPSGIGTDRQAGLLLALITYGSGNIDAKLHFTRGAFRVPASLVNAQAKRGETVLAQPESGCAGNCIGQTLRFLDGPQSGIGQATQRFAIMREPTLKLIAHTFGEAKAKAAAKLLDSYAAPKAA